MVLAFAAYHDIKNKLLYDLYNPPELVAELLPRCASKTTARRPSNILLELLTTASMLESIHGTGSSEDNSRLRSLLYNKSETSGPL